MAENTDEYNGWPNRETWATSLHLSNDEGLYEMVNELAQTAVDEASVPVYRLASDLDDQFSEWAADLIDGGEHMTRDMRMMLTDIGSLYRVNWFEVARNWLEDFEVEGLHPDECEHHGDAVGFGPTGTRYCADCGEAVGS